MGKRKQEYTSIGGQALLEGILMRGPVYTSIALRKPDGTIDLTLEKTAYIKDRYPILGLPFLRGFAGLYDSLSVGTRALDASMAYFDEEEEDAKPGFLEKLFGPKAEQVEGFLTILLSLALAIGLFMVLPTGLASFFKKMTTNVIALNLLEGGIRIGIFVAYVMAISRMKEMARVFMYHGAEHRAIRCYEAKAPLTVENVQTYSALHPRCGTSFLMTVMVVSIILMSFFGWPNPLVRTLVRLVMVPLIVGIAYEINRALAKANNILTDIFTAPGLFIQKIGTIRDPDDDMAEVAIAALELVIPENADKADAFYAAQEAKRNETVQDSEGNLDIGGLS